MPCVLDEVTLMEEMTYATAMPAVLTSSHMDIRGTHRDVRPLQPGSIDNDRSLGCDPSDTQCSPMENTQRIVPVQSNGNGPTSVDTTDEALQDMRSTMRRRVVTDDGTLSNDFPKRSILAPVFAPPNDLDITAPVTTTPAP
jgi:hypothetical protein